MTKANRNRSPMTPAPLAPLMTTAEAAEALRADPTSIRRWIASGRLPGARVGNHWLVARAAVDLLRGLAGDMSVPCADTTMDAPRVRNH